LDGNTLVHLALDILRETHRHGGRRFMIMNGHYENEAFLTEAIDLFLRECSDSQILLISWWALISDELVDEIFAEAGFPGWDTEHAGITETALMQYFAPELVREDKIIDDQSERKPPYSIYPAPDDIVPKSGVLYKATYASREKGEKIAKQVVDRIVEISNNELGE
jgi:creatinine amidohydrolase